MTPFIAELIGTFTMVLLGNSVVANVNLEKTKGKGGGWIVITTAWALAVYVGVVIAGPYSDAHLNPAVTLSNLALSKMSLVDSGIYMLAQMLGAMGAAFLVWLIHKDHFDATEDAGIKQAAFCTAPAIRNLPINLLAEIVGTFILIFAILHFTDAQIDGSTTVGMGSLGAIPVTFVVWVIGLSLGGTTGYAINPARDLGPRIIHSLLPIKNKAGFDIGYAWVPVMGPVMGSLLAVALYLIIH